MTESLNEKGDLKNGYYWFQGEASPNQIILDEWQIVEIKGNELWAIGHEISFDIWPGTYVPIRPKEDDDERVTVR